MAGDAMPLEEVEGNHLSHPSRPIHGAAYPEAPYQPGTGGQSSTSRDNASASGTQPASQPDTFYNAKGQTSHLDTAIGAAAPGLAFTNGPPPPYDSNHAPDAHSPLDTTTTPTSPIDLQPSNTDGLNEARSRGGSSVQGGSGPATVALRLTPIITPLPSRPSTPRPLTQESCGGHQGNDKLGPVAAARARKRRHLKICVIAGIALLIFLAALSVGVALGVIKGSLHRRKST